MLATEFPSLGGVRGGKKGKRSTSHRYDLIPLLRSRPGGFKGSWLCRTCLRSAKIPLFEILQILLSF